MFKVVAVRTPVLLKAAEHVSPIHSLRRQMADVFLKENTQSTFDISRAIQTTRNRFLKSINKMEQERLKRRLDNLDVLRNWLAEHPDATVKGVLGWGADAQGEKPRSGVSQYDTVYLQKDGEYWPVQLDSKTMTIDKTVASGPAEAATHIESETAVEDTRTEFEIKEVQHQDHTHFSLMTKDYPRFYGKTQLNNEDEGCPCCTAGLDFDEFAAAVNELSSSSSSTGEDPLHELAHFDSADHWGIALGVATPFAIIGLTAAIRNIKGCWSNIKKLKAVIKGVDQDIARAEKAGNTEVCERLRVFRNTLAYSKFDAEFNLVVPGVINGTASTLVLSSLVWHNPFALPVIAAYATGQFVRNGIDFIRVLNRHVEVPEKLQKITLSRAEKNELSGIKKVNQISSSKRKFHAANVLGFAAFAAGAIITFLSVPALAVGGSGGTPCWNNVACGRRRKYGLYE